MRDGLLSQRFDIEDSESAVGIILHGPLTEKVPGVKFG